MLKFAVMTTSSSLFNLICQCFHDEAIECCRFLDDVALSRAIYREDYHAILVDAATGSTRRAPCSHVAPATATAARR